MLQQVKDKILVVNPEEVIEDAREQGLEVETTKDFRNLGFNYQPVEELMEAYRSSFISSSTLSGLTTGIGGFFTALTFATVDTVTLSIQLYRLAQRFAILNGFDADDPLQQEKVLNIYFSTLGLNALIQSTMKHQFLKADQIAEEEGEPEESIVLGLIVRTGSILGKQMSTKQAGRLIPVVGGVIGASVNHRFASNASKKMKQAFKEAYIDHWLA